MSQLPISITMTLMTSWQTVSTTENKEDWIKKQLQKNKTLS